MNLQSRLDDGASGDFSASTGPIEQVRYGCALGALASVIAIEGAIPITHCGPGCAQKQFHALSGISGYQGGEFHVPSTNIGNKEVIFGGADRLDELIGSTLKVMEAELYVVQSGCVPGLVGDDVGNVVQSLSAARRADRVRRDARLSRHQLHRPRDGRPRDPRPVCREAGRSCAGDPKGPRQRLVAAALPEPVLARRPRRDPPHPRRHRPRRSTSCSAPLPRA